MTHSLGAALWNFVTAVRQFWHGYMNPSPGC